MEEAKTFFEEAKDWGVWRWLMGKEQGPGGPPARPGKLSNKYERKIKAANPERKLDEADRRLSTSMAREGAHKAIDAWVLREKLTRKMETATIQSVPRPLFGATHQVRRSVQLPSGVYIRPEQPTSTER